MQTLRYSVRNLMKAPGFTAVAILTLALGIGANTAMFSVVRAVLLAGLPYPHPDRIVQLWEQRRDGGMMQASGLNARDWRAMNRSLQSLAYYYSGAQNLSGGSEPERIDAAYVSADFFRAMSATPELGRLTAESDHRLGAAPAAAIGHSLWRRQFGARPDILGRTVRLDGFTFTIAGVMPPQFDFPDGAEVWAPLEIFPATSARSAHNYRVVARVKDGFSIRQAQSDLENVASRLARSYIDDKERSTNRLLDRIGGRS